MNEFIFPLKIFIEDTDFAGIVYHSNFLNFFERARTAWIEAIGLGFKWQQEQKLYFPVRKANLDYLRPARLTDNVEVLSKIMQIKPASMLFAQQLRLSDSPDTILCKADIKIACVDYKFRPHALPRCRFHELMGEPV